MIAGLPAMLHISHLLLLFWAADPDEELMQADITSKLGGCASIGRVRHALRQLQLAGFVQSRPGQRPPRYFTGAPPKIYSLTPAGRALVLQPLRDHSVTPSSEGDLP